jgi:hypothetical protein
MQKIIFKLTILLLPLSFINNPCKAIKVPAYIIVEHSDTIHGTIKLNKFSQITSGFILKGFDMESLHYKILFKGNADKSYKTFYPEMILGFGFTYNSVNYNFKSFLLEYKSIIKKERLKNRFLYLVYKGKVDLYKDIVYVNNTGNNSITDENQVYYEYYLFSNWKGLFRVAVNEEIKTIWDLLHQVNFEEEFIREIPEETKFKDIQTVLEKYDTWQLKHPIDK